MARSSGTPSAFISGNRLVSRIAAPSAVNAKPSPTGQNPGRPIARVVGGGATEAGVAVQRLGLEPRGGEPVERQDEDQDHPGQHPDRRAPAARCRDRRRQRIGQRRGEARRQRDRGDGPIARAGPGRG